MNTDLKSVLMATDLSKASDEPLRRALAIARHYHAKFYLAHVVSSLGYTIAGGEALNLAGQAAASEIQGLERTLVDNGALAGLSHEFIVREGDVWKQLQDVIIEKQIDLVVVGTHGRQDLKKLLLGSVAEKIFRRAECLVVTVGPQSGQDSPLENSRPMRAILFPTDFGPASLRALPYAISFSNHFAAKLVLLHVAPIAPIPEGFHWSSTTSDIRLLQEKEGQESRRRLEELASGHPRINVPPEFVVKYGAPGKMILHVARQLQSDLIVMGLKHHRHVEAASHLPWDTAYDVVCGASCAVLTVKS